MDSAPSEQPTPDPGAPGTVFTPQEVWTWSQGYTPKHSVLEGYSRLWPNHFVWSADNTPCRWSLGFWRHRQDPLRSAVGVVFGPLAGNSFGQVQGGAIGSVLDAAMLLSAAGVTGSRCQTAFLNISFRKPVQLGQAYVVLSSCRREGRKLFVDSELRDAVREEAGALVEAEALFVLPRSGNSDLSYLSGGGGGGGSPDGPKASKL